jgi:hypothetical protein
MAQAELETGTHELNLDDIFLSLVLSESDQEGNEDEGQGDDAEPVRMRPVRVILSPACM